MDIPNLAIHFSALLSKILKLININILDITGEYLDITTKYIRCLSHSSISWYWSWILIFSVGSVNVSKILTILILDPEKY